MSVIRFAVGWLIFLAVTAVYLAALALVNLLSLLGRSKRVPTSDAKLRVLITGRVNSLNWCRSHLLPLAQAPVVRELLATMDGPLIKHSKMRPCRPSAALGRMLPRALARSFSFFRTAWREKPDIIMGYSFFPGALFGLLAARMVGAVSIYNITGGLELTGGGIAKEHRLARIPDCASAVLTPLVHRLCRHFDAIVVRGQKTKKFLTEQIRPRRVEVILGSVDAERLSGGKDTARNCEVVFLGRLVAIKQPEQLLEVLARVAKRRPQLRAVIAGDGPLLPEIKARAEALGLAGNIDFPGHVEKIEELLPRSKIFLLTSKSEGLSIALAEAMIAGAVPVVADVGDLGELVKNGETGWLIPPGDFDAYARRIGDLLENEASWQRFSANAAKLAWNNNALENVTAQWNQCFASLAASDYRKM